MFIVMCPLVRNPYSHDFLMMIYCVFITATVNLQHSCNTWFLDDETSTYCVCGVMCTTVHCYIKCIIQHVFQFAQ